MTTNIVPGDVFYYGDANKAITLDLILAVSDHEIYFLEYLGPGQLHVARIRRSPTSFVYDPRIVQNESIGWRRL